MSGFFVRNAWLVPFLPLLGAAAASVAAIVRPSCRAHAHRPVIIGIALSFLFSLALLFSGGAETTTVVSRWLTITGFNIPFELRVDGLSTMMITMVTFVSTLVAIFAVGYMAGDPGYPRFFAFVGLFVFSMTGLVLSNNFVVTYAFWEGVGTCSYLLIGFWYARPSAASAALKAFLVNRLGDIGFALGIFWLWMVVPNHDLSYSNVLSRSTLDVLPASAAVGASLLFFWAATAKSAQLPLYVWLPDAMEGPTPVSALIHAATMVTAGVYLIARSAPLIALAPDVQLLVAVVGCATALLSAAIAVTQNDLKRVMAYSTVSQLGYMFMALGAGVGGAAQLAVVAAMFHLFTHAFFKALLFLASGSVMHAMGDVIDMRRFRGLRRRLPVTCWTFAVGGLALAGVPPLSGFFSKDEILLALKTAAHESHGWGWAYQAIYWTAVLVAMMTAFYTGRAFFMTFFGEEKLPSPDDPEAPAVDDHAHADAHGGHAHGAGDEHAGHADAHGGHAHEIGRESPPVMTIPLVALAGFTVLFGLISLVSGPFVGPSKWFEGHLHQTFRFEDLGHAAHGFDWPTAIVGTLAGLIGLGAAYVLYAQPSPIPGRLAARFPVLYRASLNKFYVDEIYGWIVLKPLWFSTAAVEFLDMYLVHGLVEGIARIPRLFGREAFAPYQNGLIQFYVAVSALGVAGFFLILLIF